MIDSCLLPPNKKPPIRAATFRKVFGARSGNRTRTTFGQGILSPSRLPIPPPALSSIIQQYE